MSTDTLLVELFTEELPPKALKKLGDAFALSIQQGLSKRGLLEAGATAWDRQSDEQLHLHHRWAQATTALQISIALAAIALLTRRTWLAWGVAGVAGLGIVLGGMAMAHR